MDGYRENRKLAATLYPLVGLEGTCYRFRVLKVREPIPEDNLRPIRLQRWADRLWRRELKCPVYPSARFGHPAFLIPEGDSPAVGSTMEVRDVPDKLYHIDVTDQIVEVSIDNAAGVERELVCRMLERSFTERFLSLRDDFWKAEWTLFFHLVPENEGVAEDIVNAYRGLKFRVVLLEGMGPHLAADIRTKYVGRRSLAEYSEQDEKTTLRKHLDLEIPVDDRASFIRDNGPVKIPCRYTGDTGQTIDECTFDESGETVFQYYRRRYRTVPAHPKDACVFVQDRVGEGKSLPVPISRLFPVFTTEYEELRRCSIRPQMTPEARVSTIATFLSCLSGVRYGDIPISIGTSHLMTERTVFIPPRLEFGNGEIIDPLSKGSPPPKSSKLFDSLIVRWGSKKLPALYKAGPYHNEPLPDVILLYPNTINRPTRETFLSVLSQEIQRQTGQSIRIIQQRSYSIGRSERMGSSLLRLATEVRSGNPRCLAIVILWDRFMRSVHGELKEAISPVLSQCATKRTVRSICTRFDPQRATSQLRNLALAVLTEVGVKPWVLADALHHDLHIGIDTLFGRVGYHFLYGTGGRLTERQLGECAVRGRWKVAVKKPDLRRRIEESVRSIVKNGHPIRSIIIHRDGRWWPSESAALREALQRLKADNVLPSDVRCAAVEIRKTHMPVRLFTAVQDRGTFLQNPLPGTYLVLDRSRVLLTTTGRPGAWDRRGVSAGTLLLEIMDSIGEINIEEVAEDAYWLTHLNWNAPDIEIALPVTIRWTDEALRETLRSPAQEEEDEEEWELETSESDELVSSILDKEEFTL